MVDLNFRKNWWETLLSKKIGGSSYYQKYLKEEYWINLRSKILKRDNYECKKCKSKKNLQIHHKKYRGFYKELPKDLITLCNMCHRYEHSYIKKIIEPIVKILYLLAISSSIFCLIK